ncbi:Peptidase_C39 like family protein [Micromonospora viridifaciens]|uniref:Peptidase_C39 like family protein n=1 Tax=Micromonospora viridifaciens TaxID=1881 RepID=A0A1C4ZCC4_MICVI|nr:C39 family peptidase [Micromonospora viridifaciens]SCF30391.1 Peptidase_C39 like family protein [Micromonospora viridifaciens]
MTATPGRRDVAYRRFRFPADLALGSADGVAAGPDGLVIAEPTGAIDHTDPHTGVTARYDQAAWTSPVVGVGFAAHEIVPSWTADTPAGGWLKVEVRGWHEGTPSTGWYVLGHWAAGDTSIHRHSVPGQAGDDARVMVDTLRVAAALVTGWQLRVTLFRRSGAAAGPVLRTAGAVASADAADLADAATDADGGGARGRVLDVPRYAQRLHAGGETRWGGGGDSWCSPTCVSMVLDFWGAGPTPDRYAWVDPPGPRPVVVHAARHCYDHAYAGAGNWAFNTAYAGGHGVDAFVTRLRGLAEAERFVAAGIPLIVSAAFTADQVPGLGYDTRGHLLVLVGFTADGDPVLNDPYALNDEGVRRTVPRGPFEAAWQAGSGGIAYVVRPGSVPLPPAPAQANW